MIDARIFPPDRVTILGVLNLTPDSFSDGGRFVTAAPSAEVDVEAAVAEALVLAAAGAHAIDVGGESTRPGSQAVDAAQEIARTRPVIEALSKTLRVPISIDTRKAAVAEAALEAGAVLVNDVSGGRHDPALLGVVAEAGAQLLLGHLRGEPATMQDAIHFADVVGEVASELAASAEAARAAGIPAERLAVDPGIGFGKTAAHNLELLARVGELRAQVGLPVLVGASRKGFLGQLTGDAATDRDVATHAAHAIAIFAGADAVRVHDVAGARGAAQVAHALREARS